jgi:acylpyruvate hydrolase
MRLVTFTTTGEARLGAQLDPYIIDLPETYLAWLRVSRTAPASVASFLPPALLEFLQAGAVAKEAAQQALTFAADRDNLAALLRLGLAYPAAEVTFLPPVLRPGKIVCLGLNYRSHVAETGRELPAYPVLFAKFANTLIGHRQPIVLPTVSQRVDYEAELAIIIGRTGKDIAPEATFDYIAGYTIFNDVSVRDYQRRTIQFLQGKTFDSAGPIGPALVTADEVSNPQALDLSLRLNGQVMQQANTADFIFDIPTIIHYLSQIMTLEPGDVIATGTPGGVGYARDPQVFLRPGDRIEIEIGELGVLENPVVGPG